MASPVRTIIVEDPSPNLHCQKMEVSPHLAPVLSSNHRAFYVLLRVHIKEIFG
jgi:hypothetical protein